MQRVPIDRDLAAADAEEAAKVDDGGARLPDTVHDDVDDTPHVLVGGAANFDAQNAGHDLVVEDDGFRTLRWRRWRPRRRRIGGGSLWRWRIAARRRCLRGRGRRLRRLLRLLHQPLRAQIGGGHRTRGPQNRGRQNQ
jgi:hypothetical protein